MVHALVRDLAMSCKKVSIYGVGHPSSTRAVEKPFVQLQTLLRLKNYLNINLQSGSLYVINIRLKESVFTQEIIKYMQLQDINAILFKQGLSAPDLDKVLGRFVQRVDIADHANLLTTFIDKMRIKTVEVNSELAYQLFEDNKQFRGDANYDFSLKNMIWQRLPDDLLGLSEVSRRGADYALKQGIDYDYHLVKYILPEKLASISPEAIGDELIELFTGVKTSEDGKKRNELLEQSLAIYRMVEYHPERMKIVKRLNKHFASDAIPEELARELESPTGKIRIESSQRIDDLLNNVFAGQHSSYSTRDFVEVFGRLLKTGQKEKALEVALHLVEMLSVADANFRQRALTLLLELTGELNVVTDLSLLTNLIQLVIGNIRDRKESFEYSELVWLLMEKCMNEHKYELLLEMVKAIAQRRKFEDEVTVYDSMAIKKIFGNFNRSEVINALIDEMLAAEFETASLIRQILITAGSEEVAMALSNIISHPKRSVRQQALKILGELGKASLKVFTQILVDDSMFEREAGRHELPDNKWYIIRNSIFVLGLLGDPLAAVPLRLRISDNDVRVRREIISSLEKIGGEEACDILLMMADDPVKEIRESAVITIGLIGTHEMTPMLIDLARTHPPVTLKAIAALGKVSGDQADQFLISLLEDQGQLVKLTSIDASKDDIKLAVIKALGSIGKPGTIKAIKAYKEGLSTTQKIFFKSSPVNRAIDDILSKY
jgi:HEAT repeat protein